MPTLIACRRNHVTCSFWSRRVCPVRPATPHPPSTSVARSSALESSFRALSQPSIVADRFSSPTEVVASLYRFTSSMDWYPRAWPAAATALRVRVPEVDLGRLSRTAISSRRSFDSAWLSTVISVQVARSAKSTAKRQSMLAIENGECRGTHGWELMAAH